MKKYYFVFTTLILAIGAILFSGTAAITADHGKQVMGLSTVSLDSGNDYLAASNTDSWDEAENEGEMEAPPEDDEYMDEQQPADDEYTEEEPSADDEYTDEKAPADDEYTEEDPPADDE